MRAGLPVLPIVVDFESVLEFGIVDFVDGYHRTQAAHEAGVDLINAYEVLR